MASQLLLIIFSGICAFVLCSGQAEARARRSENNDESMRTLELVHVVFRHGDRTPDQSVIYKNDPYINETYYPIGYGQLTNEGKRKEYEIGKALRRRYGKFLNNFTLDLVDPRCTDFNRTKMSLQLVLASLFPPEGDYVWEKEDKLNWQPVPFNYWPVENDHVLGDPLKNCPVFQKAQFNYLHSEEGQRLYENHREFINYLEEHTGQSLHSHSFAELYFTLTTESENGFKMPAWVTEEVYAKIKDLAIMDYKVNSATSLLRKLSSGFLVQKMIDDTHEKAIGEKYKNTKVFLYSAHESTVASLLRFLGIFFDHVPPYGSYIAIEVHNINGIRGLRVFYQDYSSEKPKRYRIPGCGNFCKIHDFKNLYKDLLPKSELECF